MEAEECLRDYIHLVRKFDVIEGRLETSSKKLEQNEPDSKEWRRGVDLKDRVESMLNGLTKNYNKSLEMQLEEIEEDCHITFLDRIKEDSPETIRNNLARNEIEAAIDVIEGLEKSVTENINVKLERQ